MNRTAASQYLRDKHDIQLTADTLAKKAVIGGGPAFRKKGRFPDYSAEDLDEFAASITSPRVRSTSELKLSADRDASSEAA